MKTTINLEYVQECFELDNNGNVIWKERPEEHFKTAKACRSFNTRHASKLAGDTRTRCNKTGVKVKMPSITLRGVNINLKRIAYLLKTGKPLVYDTGTLKNAVHSPRIINRPMPAREYLQECFILDQPTQVLYWKARPENHFETSRGWKGFNTKYAGKKAGRLTSNTNGKQSIPLNGYSYVAYKLIDILLGDS
jgi:hypothetical protein